MHLYRDEAMAEVSLGGETKKMCGCKGDTLRRDALKRARLRCVGEWVHAAVARTGGERSWSWAAENRSTTTIGPPHLGQRHRGWVVSAVEGSDWFFGGVA